MHNTTKNICGSFLVIVFFLAGLLAATEIIFFMQHKKYYFKSSRLNQEKILESRLTPREFSPGRQPPIHHLTLANNGFEDISPAGFPPGWTMSDNTTLAYSDGHDKNAVGILIRGQVFQKKAVTGENNSGPYILSAWIKTSQEQNAYVQLESNDLMNINYHPGDGRWQLISVVFPKNDASKDIRVVLGADRENAVFDDVRLVLGRKQNLPALPEGNGSRFRELISSQKSGQFRILALGGSTTYGHADFYRTWPYILEQKLNSYYPGQFEIINLGIPGCSTEQLLYFSSKSPSTHDGFLDLNPDMVIIMPVWNDFLNDFSKHHTNMNTINQRFRENWFVRKTALGYYVYRLIYAHLIEGLFANITEEFPENQKFDENSDEYAGRWLNFFASDLNRTIPGFAFGIRLEKIIELYRDSGVSVMLATSPCIWPADVEFKEARQVMEKYQVEEAKTPENMIKAWLFMEEWDRQVITKVAGKTNQECEDFTEYFRNRYPTMLSRVEFFQDGTHFNLNGNTLLADYLFNAESFQRLVKGRETDPL